MSDYKQNTDVSRYAKILEKREERVQKFIANIQQEVTKLNPPNVPMLAQNAQIQAGARQKQCNPPNVLHNEAYMLMVALNDPENPHNLGVMVLEANENQLPSGGITVFQNNFEIYVPKAEKTKQEAEHSNSYIKQYLFPACIQFITYNIGAVAHAVYLRPYESCQWIYGMKTGMRWIHYAFDASEASAALRNCIASKKVMFENKAGLTTCWEDVYDKYGKKAKVIVVNGTPGYIEAPLTRPQFFELLKGKPQKNSVELTPWIADLTPEDICALIDKNGNKTIELEEVKAAKHDIFLVAGLEDQIHLDRLNRMLTDNPETHGSQCIAWLNTLPQSNPEIPGLTGWGKFKYNMATTLVEYAPILVISVLQMAATGGGPGAGKAFVTLLAGNFANRIGREKWIPVDNVLDPNTVTGQPFGGSGNKVGK
jgi:hypothetical protein